jgi:hypothetical protein
VYTVLSLRWRILRPRDEVGRQSVRDVIVEDRVDAASFVVDVDRVQLVVFVLVLADGQVHVLQLVLYLQG